MRVALTGGSYVARSLIANAQRCINLFPEKNPPDSPVPYTHYQTPGLTLLAKSPIYGAFRGLIAASNGNLYGVIKNVVYSISANWIFTQIGTMASTNSQVSISDNGLVAILVDGTKTGYCIQLSNNAFAKITDPNFLGANTVDYIDTFFIFNQPNTANWYSSLSNITFAMLTTPAGGIVSGTITPGSGYTNGTFTNVPVTGGSGTGAIATITVVGGAVTSGVITTPGINYAVGDTVSASLAGGTGFIFTVSVITTAAFNPLYIAAKSGYSDILVGVIVVHHEIWLIGLLTTEIWYNAGNPNFPFQIIPGVFVNHGCIAINSIQTQDIKCYWLGSDRQGQRIVFSGYQYQAKRISTHAIEAEFATYSTVSDAIGMVYQQNGHTFYMLTFPTANKTWVYDEATEFWHQRAATDTQGNLMRHWANCIASAYNSIVVGDFVNGNLYKMDPNVYLDNGNPIKCIRGFPHMMGQRGERTNFSSFIADMEVGNDTGAIDGTSQMRRPQVSLKWSDDRGVTFGNAVLQSLGPLGYYRTQLKWNRLGIARDRVFELEWSIPTKTALNGAFIEILPAGS